MIYICISCVGVCEGVHGLRVPGAGLQDVLQPGTRATPPPRHRPPYKGTWICRYVFFFKNFNGFFLRKGLESSAPSYTA